MADKLEPCPFCGKAMMFRAALWPSEGDRDGIIHAEPTDCPLGPFENGTADESIIELWNRRASPAAAGVEGECWAVHSRTGIHVGLWPDRADAEEALRQYDGGTITHLVRAFAIESLQRERDEARSIVRDIHWMAVRYADNRKSYAVGMCNDALRKAYDAGWLVYKDDKQHDLDPQYARDGMFDREWRSAVDAATDRAESAEARIAELERERDAFFRAAQNALRTGSVLALEGLYGPHTPISVGTSTAALSDSPAAEPVAGQGEATHRHKKRGTEYVLIGYGKMQAEGWKEGVLIANEAGQHTAHIPVDMREVVIYRSADDGSLWVRPREEFEDGRFETIASPRWQEGGEG